MAVGEAIHPFAFGLSVGVITAGFTFGFCGLRYIDGQHDALDGKWYSQKVEAADGTTQYIELSKPTSRPIVVSRSERVGEER